MTQTLRLVSHDTDDGVARSSLAAAEQRVDGLGRCDRYERCNDAPGAMPYADYLEKQNRRKPVAPDDRPTAKSEAATAVPKPGPVDSGLGPKLGEIPTDPVRLRSEQRIRIAYQLMRHAPAGSLVDVII